MITESALGKRYKVTYTEYGVKRGVSGPVTQVGDDTIVVSGRTIRVDAIEQATEVTR